MVADYLHKGAPVGSGSSIEGDEGDVVLDVPPHRLVAPLTLTGFVVCSALGLDGLVSE
jgi:hypothetical protein